MTGWRPRREGTGCTRWLPGPRFAPGVGDTLPLRPHTPSRSPHGAAAAARAAEENRRRETPPRPSPVLPPVIGAKSYTSSPVIGRSRCHSRRSKAWAGADVYVLTTPSLPPSLSARRGLLRYVTSAARCAGRKRARCRGCSRSRPARGRPAGGGKQRWPPWRRSRRTSCCVTASSSG